VHLPRRLAVLLASGLLALAPAAPALAQSAGDEQYADPLGQDDGKSTSTMPSNPPALSDEPRTPAATSGGGTAGSGTAAPAAPAAPPATAAAGSGTASAQPQLPNTGLDARLVGAFGVALVLLGIGLRLRVADVRP
jgi:hypothetical protein